MKTRNRVLIRYGVAVLAVAAGFLLREALARLGAPGLPTYITFYPAVMIAAVFAGLGPGLTAALLTALVVDYWIVGPRGLFAYHNATEIVGQVLFVSMGVFMTAVAEMYRRSRAKAAAYEKELILRESQEQVRQQREWLRVTLTSIGDAVLATDTAARVTFLNPLAAKLTGWTEQQAVGEPIHSVFRIINELTRQPGDDIVGRVLGEGRVAALADHAALIARDGRETPVEDSAAPIRDAAGQVIGVVLVFHDVTEKRRAQAALRESEQRVRRKLDSVLSPEGDIGLLDLGDIIDAEAVQALMDDFYRVARVPMSILDVKGKVLVGVGWQDLCTRFHRANAESWKHCLESDLHLSAGLGAGEVRLYECKNRMWDMATPIMIAGRHVGNVFSGQFFFEGEQVDRERFREQARAYGFDETEYLAALDRVPRLSRETVDRGMSFFQKLADMLSKLGYSNVKLAKTLAERERLTESLRASQETLHQTVGELERSNRELEQFAYVTSHDLQEPLRQVRSFVELLRERHAEKLDGKAAQYMQFVHEGASRMSGLVADLLAYSRVGAPGKTREPTACRRAFDAAQANLKASIDEARARVTCDELPTLSADATQLTQLFQNLIGNAVKFRRQGVPPEVHVGCRRDGDYWLFSVRDNGIGIEPEHYDKVFLIFQRLHGCEEYPGTGIGLAICKKIVEQHGGTIWVESEPGQGSTFYFRLSGAGSA